MHLAMPYLIAQNRRVAGLAVDPSAPTARGKRVAILGGGDTSADCLGNVIREGALSVVEIAHGPTPPREREPLRTWPEWPTLMRSYAAHEEGGEREWQVQTLALEGRDGHVAAPARAPRRVSRLGRVAIAAQRARSRTSCSRSTSC